MSVTTTLPVDSKYHRKVIDFLATFNVPTLTKFDFDIPANQNIEFLTLPKNSLFIIDTMSFSMTIPEDFFQEARDIVPLLTIRKKANGENISITGHPIVTYLRQLPSLIFVYSSTNDKLTASLIGTLDQTANLIGINTITASAQFNIYRVKNNIYLKRFLDPTTDLGATLKMRGLAQRSLQEIT